MASLAILLNNVHPHFFGNFSDVLVAFAKGDLIFNLPYRFNCTNIMV